MPKDIYTQLKQIKGTGFIKDTHSLVNITSAIASIDLSPITIGLSSIMGTAFVKDTDSLINLSHKAGTKGTDAIYDAVAGLPAVLSEQFNIIRKRLWKLYRKMILGEKVGDD